ncbi:redoxin family protein [Streptomyces cyanogenus]|uniref:redoxin family protein n=1 Tax=Streptomyces cyanogenus TaxID=80860 RepID=UPI001AA1A0C7
MAVFNLFLTMAVIRRLKQNAPDLAEPDLPELPPGSRLPDFHGESISGTPVTAHTVAGTDSIFAFYDTGCSACKTTIPQLIGYAQGKGLKPDQVIAVVGGDRAAADVYAAELDGVATVIVEDTLGPVASAFSISGIPAFVQVDSGGTVVRSGTARGVLTSGI